MFSRANVVKTVIDSTTALLSSSCTRKKAIE